MENLQQEKKLTLSKRIRERAPGKFDCTSTGFKVGKICEAIRILMENSGLISDDLISKVNLYIPSDHMKLTSNGIVDLSERRTLTSQESMAYLIIKVNEFKRAKIQIRVPVQKTETVNVLSQKNAKQENSTIYENVLQPKAGFQIEMEEKRPDWRSIFFNETANDEVYMIPC